MGIFGAIGKGIKGIGKVSGLIDRIGAPVVGAFNPLLGAALGARGAVLGELTKDSPSNTGGSSGAIGPGMVGDPLQQQAVDLGGDRARAREQFFGSFNGPQPTREDLSNLFRSANVFANNPPGGAQAQGVAPQVFEPPPFRGTNADTGNTLRDLIGRVPENRRGEAGRIAQAERLAPQFQGRNDNELNAIQLLKRRELAGRLGRLIGPPRERAN